MSNPLLKLVDISKYYTSKDAVTLGLRKVNAEFHKGEFVAITGESGSGKSTLLNVLSGIDSYEEGEMYLDGQETSCFTNREWDDYRRKNIAFVFQDYSLIDSYTVLQNVELSLYDNYPDKQLRRKRALELLDKVGLLSHKRHKCTKLSGGQKQRVAIARALAKDAPIILADEPTGNLDSETSKSIIKLMAETAKDKLLVMVTHNYDDVADYATRKIRMYDGGIAEDKTIIAPIEDVNNNVKAIADDEEEKKAFKGSVRIAVNNLLATPKRSLFILSTSFISTLLIALFLFSYVNIIIPPAGMNMSGDRKDTLFAIKENRSDLTSTDLTAIEGIKGVEAALSDFTAYNMIFYPKTMIWSDVNYTMELGMNVLTVANFGNKVPTYGAIPANDNEILLGHANKGKPDQSMIGKEIELVLTGPNDYYYDGMYDDPYMNSTYYTKTYTISGYAPDEYCYVTDNAIEALSIEYVANACPHMEFNTTSYININDDEISSNNYITTSRIRFIEDDSIPLNTIYYVYNPSAEIGGIPIYQNWEYTELSTFGSIFEGVWDGTKAKQINASMLVSQSYNQQYLDVIILPATPTTNSEIYNAYNEDNDIPQLVINKTSNPYTIVTSKSTSLVVISQDAKATKVIELLTDAGYKVVYPYSRPLSVMEVVLKLIQQLMGVVVGLVIITIAVSLISEVYTRVSKSKKRDFNILRTVGLSTSIIKGINYAEFIIVNIFAFTLTFLTFIIFAIIGKVGGIAAISNAVNSLLPYGALNYQSFIVYALVFALLMLLTLFIARKFNKKMFRTSVKKSLTETA